MTLNGHSKKIKPSDFTKKTHLKDAFYLFQKKNF